MDKKKTITILKTVAIVSIIVLFVFLLRANSYNLSVIPEEQKSVFIDSTGLPYFSEMDSYYNLRLTQNFITNGSFGNTVNDEGSPWDSLRYSPEGLSAEYEPMITYVTAFLYYLANVFSDMPLKEVAFWTGAIIAPLGAIPAYIFVRRISNDYGAISAALIITLAPSYFGHTFAGFFDTDMFQVVLPIFVVLFFIESIRNDNLKYRIIFALLSLASILLFSMSWQGYIFYVALLVIFVIVYLIAGFLMKTDVIKPIKDYPDKLTWLVNQREIFSVLLMLVLGFIGVTVTGNLQTVINSIMTLAGSTQLQAMAQTTSFPNVMISVGELQVPSILYNGIWGALLSNQGGVINGIGGILAFFATLIMLFIFAQRLWKLRSVGNNRKGKASKNQNQSFFKSKSGEEEIPVLGSNLSSLNNIDQLKKAKRDTLLYTTLFFVWLGLTTIALFQGSRFILAFVIPVGLCTGIFVGYAVTYVKNKIDKDNILIAISAIGAFCIAYPIQANMGEYGAFSFLILIIIALIAIYGSKKISFNPNIKKTVVILIITLAFITPSITGAYQTSVNTIPGTSDPMWDSMLWIKDNTSQDTVITSWWDFGYLFQIAANRSTTFDGGSQNTPRAFWVGKAMTTNDSELSAGIFTMLATSGDNAFITLDKYTNNTGKSVEILEKTLPLSKEEAKTIMTNEYKLSSTQADAVLKYSHPANPKPVIFVASSDLIQKAYWWTYFGNWDFESQKSEGYSYLSSDIPVKMKNLSGGRQQAIVTNLDEGDMLYQTIITKGSENNSTNVSFVARHPNGSAITYPNGTEFKPMLNNETVKIYRLFLVEDGFLTRNETLDKTGKHTLFVFGDNGTYFSILMSKELEYSTFTKLYILGGFGQDSFEAVHSESGVSLWKVK